MTDTIDSAASAFDVAIGNAPAPKSGNDSGKSQPTDVLFGGLGDLDQDEENPTRGGGDNEPDPKPKRQSKEEAPSEEEDDEVDPDAEEDGDEDTDEVDDKDDKEEGDFYEVMVDGERREVGLREALDGYIRQETFHRRMNHLDGIRKTIVGEAEKTVAMRDEYVTKLSMADKLLEALVPQEPDWAAEYTANPQGAKVLQDQYNSLKRQREAIQAEIGKVKTGMTEDERNAQIRDIQAHNEAILRNNPNWKDPKIRERDIRAMADTARNAGFSEEEITNTTDSRMITVLKKAMLYDKLQAAKPKPVRRGPQPVKPGAGTSRTAPKGVVKAQAQLRRTGSVDDAAAVFANLIKG